MMRTTKAAAVEGTAAPRWQRLDERFWVGSIGDRCLGTVERGRSFTLLDRDGETRGGYRTLQEAQLAALGHEPASRSGDRTRPSGSGTPSDARTGTGRSPRRLRTAVVLTALAVGLALTGAR